MSTELELQLLERPGLSWKGRELQPASRRSLPLLAYLALNPGITTRSELVRVLWEDGRLVNLRQELYKIRQLPGSSEWFNDSSTAGQVSLKVSSDLSRLQQAAAGHRYQYLAERFRASHRIRILDGIDLGFLPPAFHEWLEQENSQLELLLVDSFHALAREQEEAGQLGAAIETYRQLLRIDPFAESAHRGIMRLEVAAGRPEEAVQQLDRTRFLFRNGLDAELVPDAGLAGRSSAVGRASESAPQRRLPQPKTPFVGRVRELQELDALFSQPDSRIVSVVGLGGVGKSRLVLEFARLNRHLLPDGVVYLPLANTERADLIPASLASMLGLPFDGEDCQALVLDHIAGRSYLLVFDNVEQLPAVADLVSQFVERSPGSRVMVTSQMPLGLQAERVYSLYGLSRPAGGDQVISGFDAVRLFQQSARKPPAEDDLPHVAQICRLLHGLPLGIELAAGLTRHLSCAEIARELETGNFGVLAAEHVDRPYRHRALRTLLQATWQALSPAARQQAARLSVFPRAFSRQDARLVADVGFHDLRHLVDRSLLTMDPGGMLSMHNVVRWFAAEQLLAAPRGRATGKRLHQRAAERIRERHDDASPRTLEDLEPWLDAVHHLVLAEEFDEACRFLNHFDIKLLLRWGQAHLVLELHQELYPRLTDTELKGRSQNSMGLALRRLGRLQEAILAFNQALEHSRQAGDADNQANYLGNLGIAFSVAGNLTRAIELHEQAVELSRSTGNSHNEGIDLGCIGLAYNRLGEVDKAIHYHELALMASREAGDRNSEANHLGNLARIYSKRGELVHALAYVRAALALRRELNDRRGEALDLHCLAEIHERQGESGLADDHYRAALALNRKIGEVVSMAETLFAFGRFLHAGGQVDEALGHVREALQSSRTVGDRHLEGELLTWLGQHHSEAGDEQSAAALWLMARSVLPEERSEPARRVQVLLEELSLFHEPERVKNLLQHGTELLVNTTGVGYTLPHLDVLPGTAVRASEAREY